MTRSFPTPSNFSRATAWGLILAVGLTASAFAGPSKPKDQSGTVSAAPLVTLPTRSEQAQPSSAPSAQAQGNVIEVATAAGQFSTLVAAINAAGLAQTLGGEGPFTVFAPSDAAFAKLPAGTLESLLMPENKLRLAAILSFHVVPGRVASADLANVTTTPATVQGGTLRVDTTAGIKVNGATVTSPDISASNGVIHVIDTVLMPPAT